MTFIAEHICFVYHCHGCNRWFVTGFHRESPNPKKCPVCMSDDFVQTASVDGPKLIERYLNRDRNVRRDLTEFDKDTRK
jgi:hypothetical protein